MPLKARQHQGPVQMSGCCETSQKEAVSQWKPGGQHGERSGDAAEDPYATVKVQINLCENKRKTAVFLQNIFFNKE